MVPIPIAVQYLVDQELLALVGLEPSDLQANHLMPVGIAAVALYEIPDALNPASFLRSHYVG
jgi:hypothetical protein